MTDALGNYLSSGGFAAGTYYAATASGAARGAGGNYINARYASGNCLLACNVTGGTAIAVSSSPVTGIDFALGQGIGFGGKVVDGANNPLALVEVDVYDGTGVAAGVFQTDSLGRFAANGLPAGTYYARTRNVLGLQDVLFGGAPCNGNCNVLAGNAVGPINAGNQPQNIDFVLTSIDLVYKNGFE
jgi:hypothetical protein